MAAMSFTLRTPAHGSLLQSGIEAASRFDTRFRHRQTRAPGSYRSLPLHTAPHSTLKVSRLRLLCLSIDGVTEAHQVCLVTSGIGTTSRTDTRCFSTMPDTMLDRSFRNAYGSARAHSMLQSSCATLPLPASPVLSLRSGIVGGVSLSEVLHYARRTQCLSPPNEHSPTSPNHEIKAQAS